MKFRSQTWRRRSTYTESKQNSHPWLGGFEASSIYERWEFSTSAS